MSISPGSELSVRSESVQRVYGFYIADRFRVNRRYQRKLVWSVEEKQKLIDSILRDLPVPLFLVAEIGQPSDAVYELIDGMQRLNAIFAFLENEFSTSQGYFDLDALADTKLKKDEGSLVQKDPVMPRTEAVKVANYALALSIYRATDSSNVDEVFRRINSGGRRLSRQELRQAGTISLLADLVREIASTIRGDTSPESVVPLRSMPQLSISSRELPYGVTVDDIFWVRNGILRREDVRESLDEQLVLDILIDCLVDPAPKSGTFIRDDYYDYTESEPGDSPTKASMTITHLIETYGCERIKDDFLITFDSVRDVIEHSGKKFSSLIGAGSGGRSPRYFHALFSSFFQLVIRERHRIKDRTALAGLLNGIAERGNALQVPPGGGDWQRDTKRNTVNAVKGVIQGCFEPTTGPQDLTRMGYATRLETLLGNARIEQQLFDAKQGLLRLDDTRSFDQDLVKRICCTLTGMANSGPDAVGHVVLGIADSESDARRINQLDGVEPLMYRGFRIMGIDREAKVRGEELNDYYHYILNQLESGGLEPAVANGVRSESRLIPYQGHDVAILTIKAGSAPTFINGSLYERSGSDTVKVPQDEYMRIFARFVVPQPR